ncbi:hypothetical protein D1007_53239 [Hordeum vulgare]|uniref:Predicted protein n=1 Tax=Hordeum vulgare subsp. vulgare TaxID=112509 RepID=F2D3B8_HORVV|nr:uncharacterized protein LOC123401878 [Hordeum vulgare subsp. vulgare]KAE8774407.1 hypothetical protein D1007_53239 [Hordeum vulgare]BAJ89589.1 predicted protein [Hordeum vulgare subsp. vulgare]
MVELSCPSGSYPRMPFFVTPLARIPTPRCPGRPHRPSHGGHLDLLEGRFIHGAAESYLARHAPPPSVTKYTATAWSFQHTASTYLSSAKLPLCVVGYHSRQCGYFPPRCDSSERPLVRSSALGSLYLEKFR